MSSLTSPECLKRKQFPKEKRQPGFSFARRRFGIKKIQTKNFRLRLPVTDIHGTIHTEKRIHIFSCCRLSIYLFFYLSIYLSIYYVTKIVGLAGCWTWSNTALCPNEHLVWVGLPSPHRTLQQVPDTETCATLRVYSMDTQKCPHLTPTQVFFLLMIPNHHFTT